MNHDPRSERANGIAILNDRFRRTFRGGRVLVTTGVRGHGGAFLGQVLSALHAFDDFTKGNDPHGEHDFGAFTVVGRKLFWKINYYDRSGEYASPDPADPAVTRRCLTLMLAQEW